MQIVRLRLDLLRCRLWNRFIDAHRLVMQLRKASQDMAVSLAAAALQERVHGREARREGLRGKLNKSERERLRLEEHVREIAQTKERERETAQADEAALQERVRELEARREGLRGKLNKSERERLRLEEHVREIAQAKEREREMAQADEAALQERVRELEACQEVLRDRLDKSERERLQLEDHVRTLEAQAQEDAKSLRVSIAQAQVQCFFDDLRQEDKRRIQMLQDIIDTIDRQHSVTQSTLRGKIERMELKLDSRDTIIEAKSKIINMYEKRLMWLSTKHTSYAGEDANTLLLYMDKRMKSVVHVPHHRLAIDCVIDVFAMWANQEDLPGLYCVAVLRLTCKGFFFGRLQNRRDRKKIRLQKAERKRHLTDVIQGSFPNSS
jgi:DNA repair exonuclease SbcCD ATPase subunit